MKSEPETLGVSEENKRAHATYQTRSAATFSGLENERAWEAATQLLQQRWDRATFETWLRPTTVLPSEGDSLRIGVPSSYVYDMLTFRLKTRCHSRGLRGDRAEDDGGVSRVAGGKGSRAIRR